MFYVEHGGAEQTPAGAGPAFPTTPEAVMRYRVTWNVEVVALDEGSSPPDIPKVDAGGSPEI